MGLCLLIKGKWRAIMSSERMWHSSLSCHPVSFQGALMQVDFNMKLLEYLIEIYLYFFSTSMFICISIFSAIKQLQNASVYSSPGILRVYSFDILTDCSCGLWRHLCWQPYSLLCLTWGVPFTELRRYIRKVNYLTREALPHAFFFSFSALCWQTQRETFKKRPIGHWGATVKTAKVLCW